MKIFENFKVVYSAQKCLKYFEICNRSLFYLYTIMLKFQVYLIIVLEVMAKWKKKFWYNF